jgi:hypothetical protein
MKSKIKNLNNIFGWSTKRKIIVIESDDWGSIRMPSNKTFDMLFNKGFNLLGPSEIFNKYDTLASVDDLSSLFETLSTYRDYKGNNPVITAISVVANPDFKKIKESDYTEYYYEPFIDTLDKYYSGKNPFPLWKEGIMKRLFVPQFHGREHLNVAIWMKALQNKDTNARIAFDCGYWGYNNQHQYGITYNAAFDLEKIDQIIQQAEIIKDGLLLFKKIFGYNATYFVPPNGFLNNKLQATTAEGGIRFIYGDKIQKEPVGSGKTKTVFHYPGQKTNKGQYYITRNCLFEPSNVGQDWVDRCMNDINTAFSWRKPAVICSHRVNYIGALQQKNRLNGLSELSDLLKQILSRWPDAEFMTSDQLGLLMTK